MREESRGGKEDRAEAERLFRDAARDIFASRCKAAWLSGSFLYNGAKPGRSDIDIVVVFDESTRFPADAETLEQIRAFVDVYLDVHRRFDLDPDLEFPAEYVVPSSIEQALSWRGLVVDGEMAEQFPTVEHSDYWLGRPDRWFNAWVSETAFSRFLTGDAAYHRASKLAAWKTILRFLMLRSDGRAMGLDDFWPGLAQFGAKESYLPFWPTEQSWVEQAFAELHAEGALEWIGDRVVPIRGSLEQWEAHVKAAIAVDRSTGPLLLPVDKHDEIAAWAEARWAATEQTRDKVFAE